MPQETFILKPTKSRLGQNHFCQVLYLCHVHSMAGKLSECISGYDFSTAFIFKQNSQNLDPISKYYLIFYPVVLNTVIFVFIS